MESVAESYFDWIKELIRGQGYDCTLRRLHEIDFSYLIPMDANRYADGIDLRYQYCCDTGQSYNEVAVYLDNRPCSVLEMIAALALRCENDFMSDPDYGDRTYLWFWGMMQSLGLDAMDDNRYDPYEIDIIVDRFLKREYQPNGKGGLFTVEGRGDLRQVEIWYQACWYLNEERY